MKCVGSCMQVVLDIFKFRACAPNVEAWEMCEKCGENITPTKETKGWMDWGPI